MSAVSTGEALALPPIACREFTSKIVVEGAVEIVDDAMTRLKDRGIDIEPAHRSKIVGNLLAIICGDAKVQPTYAIQDYETDAMTEYMQKMVELLDGIKTQLAGKTK